jgi:SAM-dependent methyltransferase
VQFISGAGVRSTAKAIARQIPSINALIEQRNALAAENAALRQEVGRLSPPSEASRPTGLKPETAAPAANQAAASIPFGDRRIPPPAVNYNAIFDGDREAYRHAFIADACLKELPSLIRIADLKPSSTLFDYGCGLGRLAYPASNYLDQTGCYLGYEPNPDALAFLKGAYSDRPNFRFFGDVLQTEEDYVAIQQGRMRTEGKSAESVDLLKFIDTQIDVQWSMSVFTHMWPDAIVHILKQMKPLVGAGICVNTWLIVDDYAAYILRCGLADRTLPHRVNGALTYSLENPLICTAYELTTVRDIYARAGHRIIDILWGSWSGRENGITYIDVIVSRPM